MLWLVVVGADAGATAGGGQDNDKDDACFSGLSWLKYSQKWKNCRAQARPSWRSKQDSRAERNV